MPQASYGVNLIRFFGNINGVGQPAGYGYTDTTGRAILVSIDSVTLMGTYDETSFQRFDLVLADACELSEILATNVPHMHTTLSLCIVCL